MANNNDQNPYVDVDPEISGEELENSGISDNNFNAPMPKVGGAVGNFAKGFGDAHAAGANSNPSSDIARGVRKQPSNKAPSNNLEKESNLNNGKVKQDDGLKNNLPKKDNGLNKKGDLNNNSNPATGVAKPNKENSDNKNGGLGSNSSTDKKSDNSPFSKIGNRISNLPFVSKSRNLLSKVGLGGEEGLPDKDDNENDDNGKTTAPGSQGIMAPGISIGKFKISIPVLSLFAIFLLILFLLIMFSVLFLSFEDDDAEDNCNGLTYGSSDSTEFLCNMTSPFGPAADGKEYDVSSTSGRRVPPKTNGGYGSGFHKGTDIVGIVGGSASDLYAVADGEVVSASSASGWGNNVLIKHDTSSAIFYTRYAHMSSMSVSKGDKVKAGDKIGVMGATGNVSGVHLHFELLDENQNYLSANPFFGYSDQGYEDCLIENSSIDATKCDYAYTADARRIGQEGFKQICGKTGSYVSNLSNQCCETQTSSNSGSIFSFISVFEGTGKRCKASDGSNGYVVYADSLANGKLTVGPGVTSDYIDGMKVGDCLSESDVSAGYEKAEKSKRNMIQSTFAEASLSKNQEDAMVSMAYNGCGTFFSNIATAAKNDDLAGVWKAMKDCTNNGLLGLERRRKAEFALYVTGDYSEETAKKYKEKTWTDLEYNDYDSEGVLAKIASGSSSQCVETRSTSSGSGSASDIVAVAKSELASWKNLSDAQKCATIKEKYMPACGYGGKGVHDYCAGFVSYVLKTAGVQNVGGTCMANSFANEPGFHKSGGNYVPKPGDVAVFSGHVAIVTKVVGNSVEAIGGNQSPFNLGSCPNNAAGHSLGNVTQRQSFNINSVNGYTTYQ